MPAYRKQHFVPKFFMKGFASAPKRVHLYNKKRRSVVKDASLRRQCAKANFYGADHEIELQFGEIERWIAPRLARLRKDQSRFEITDDVKMLVVQLVALLDIRTDRRISEMRQLATSFFDDSTPEEMSMRRIASEMPMIDILKSNLEAIFEGIGHLQIHFISDRKKGFLVGDAPVAHYNQYCEYIQDHGVLGLGQKGIQLTLPLSPTLTLLLFDGGTYKLRTSTERSTGHSTAARRDVEMLNRLQISRAYENVYFASDEIADEVNEIFGLTQSSNDGELVKSKRIKRGGGVELAQSFARITNIRFDLSFLRVKPGAAKIPVRKRPFLMRDGSYRPDPTDLFMRDFDEFNSRYGGSIPTLRTTRPT